jgi:hypothetical protein
VDIWISAVGTSRIEVQIRDTELGLPTKSIITAAQIEPGDLVAGQYNRFSFPPIPLAQNTEYAITVLSDDAVASAGVAQLGKWDAAGGRWITAQPYSIGVMLSSSNASTWTPHQGEDLTFRLLEPAFTVGANSLDLGTVTLDGATDIMVDADIEIYAEDCSVEFVLDLPSGDSLTVSAGQPIALGTPETGDMSVTAILTGTASAAPVLLPSVQILHGVTNSTGAYITRVIPAGAATTVTVVYEALTPGSSSIAAHCQPSGGGATWTLVPVDSGVLVGDDWEEVTHKLTGFTDDDVRVRLTLSGSATERPQVRKLRVVTT